MLKYSSKVFISFVLPFAVAFAVLPILSGCGPKLPADLPKLYPVKLTFTQEGAPLSGAMIALIPESGNTHYTSGGSTNEQGILQVKTHGVYSGVPEGKYTVTVTKEEIIHANISNGVKPANEEEAHKIYEANKNKSKTEGYRLVDPKYNSPQTSELKISVDKTGTDQTFDLGKAVKIKMNESDFR